MKQTQKAADGRPKAGRRQAAAPKRVAGAKATRGKKSPVAEAGQFARLRRERDEAVERQATTAEILKIVSQSHFDLQAVLEALVSSAVRLCNADTGIIRRREGDLYPMAASFGFTEAERDHFAGYSAKPDRGSVFGRAILERRSIHVPDLLADSNLSRDRLEDYTRAVKIRSGLGVPLLREGAAIGVFTLQRWKRRPYTRKQIELVETFANQAVIAIENTRLFDEVQAQRRYLSEALTYQTGSATILKVIASSPTDVGPVLQAIVDSACELCDADDAVVHLRHGEELHYSAHHGTIPVGLQTRKLNRSFVTGRAILDKVPIQLRDVLSAEGNDFPEAQEMSRLVGTRTLLAMPLLRDGEGIGSIVLRRTKVNPFTDKQITLLQTFADQAVIAIENARLFNETREALERQTATSDVLKIISRSSVELEMVLDTLVQAVARLCRADQVYMFHLRHDLWHLIADYGLSEEATAYFQTNPFTPGRGSTSGRAAMEGRAVSITDVLHDPEYTLGEGQAIAGYDRPLAFRCFGRTRS